MSGEATRQQPPGPRDSTGPGESFLLADGHVHIYPCFDLARQLRTAYRNFGKHASSIVDGADWSGCLLLSESAGYGWYQTLRLGEVGDELHPAAPGWVFTATAEPETILANGPDGERLFIIAGRQIVVAENLEVLALCTSGEFADGSPMSSMVEQIREADGLAVIPWGAGKWWFGRGSFLAEFVRGTGDVYLGDNSNRPYFMKSAEHFQIADEMGVPVLPGTDPLPIPGEEARTGAFGFAVSGVTSLQKPSAAIRTAVRRRSSSIINFGTLETLPRFIVNQARINLRKRLRRFREAG